VQSALSRLPEEVRRRAVIKSGSAILLAITLQSPDKTSMLFISNCLVECR
jgi:hypothetical protein